MQSTNGETLCILWSILKIKIFLIILFILNLLNDCIELEPNRKELKELIMYNKFYLISGNLSVGKIMNAVCETHLCQLVIIL